MSGRRRPSARRAALLPRHSEAARGLDPEPGCRADLLCTRPPECRRHREARNVDASGREEPCRRRRITAERKVQTGHARLTSPAIIARLRREEHENRGGDPAPPTRAEPTLTERPDTNAVRHRNRRASFRLVIRHLGERPAGSLYGRDPLSRHGGRRPAHPESFSGSIFRGHRRSPPLLVDRASPG